MTATAPDPTPVERHIMIALARGDGPKAAFLACPRSVYSGVFSSFLWHWRRVSRWQRSVR